MPEPRSAILDGNEAAASVAHRLSEVIAIYPITPSSTMGELADEWSAHGRTNLWGVVPKVTEMQSEAGAAGAVHGALQAGALATTFTASQGLLLMIPNMYKIAGELTPFCMHVSARAIATHALSIFGDHSDVMACRGTGFAMLASGSVQEAHDLACIAHAATLASRVPFLHFFDGFRTSHEVARCELLSDDDLRALIDEERIAAHRKNALTPDRPVLRGTAQNPDVFFQCREAANTYYDACPATVAATMDRFAARTGRRYRLFEYDGHPQAERVMVMMGSAAGAAREAVDWMASRGERVGLVTVRLFRPFDTAALMAAIPPTARALAVMDRTKEPGSAGEPLYQDVATALFEADRPAPRMIGVRYGLGSREFTPAMAVAVLESLDRPQTPRHATIGIVDDVTGTSIPWDADLDLEGDDVRRAVFFGLGSDGTVSANRGSVKIIGEDPAEFPQAYFVYDSKKSGSVTVSHLRFSKRPLRSHYLIRKAGFVACHQFPLLERGDLLDAAAPGATLLLNAPHSKETLWEHLPAEARAAIIEKKLRLFTIDAYAVASRAGLGGRISTIMQVCFFALSGVLPADEAIRRIKDQVRRTYQKKGEEIVRRNHAAVDQALEHLHEVPVPAGVPAGAPAPAPAPTPRAPLVPESAPEFVRRVTAALLEGRGELLPVSAFPVDGTWPVGTARWEKRNIAQTIPVWDPAICIQCNKCAFVCPHAAIRAKVFHPDALAGAPETFKSIGYRGHEFAGHDYALQVAPEDCTGCSLCVAICPARDRSNPRHKAIDMMPQAPLREPERQNYDFFLNLPEPDRQKVRLDLKGSQFLEPLFEYSGACAGCGETPYLKLLSQLVGDRLMIANATGCSSIYGGNLPTTPWTANRDGRGPAWANSLFEDNAEFGLGFRLAVDQMGAQARHLLSALAPGIGEALVDALTAPAAADEAGIAAQRERVVALRRRLATIKTPDAARLDLLADYLVPRSVWIVGGDGWAYDIGYGGLDHVLALGEKVNILVMDTEVYSNTGGQQSKATPTGAAAKFAAAGKATAKKDLGLLAMAYGTAYVARIAFGAKDVQTLKAIQEAEAYPGPAIVIAYSPCIAHGYDLARGAEQQKLAVETGHWPLYRFDPRRIAAGESPLQLDSPPPKGDIDRFARNETRFLMVERQDPVRFRELMRAAGDEARRRWQLYENLAAAMKSPRAPSRPAAAPAAATAPPTEAAR